MNFTEYLAKKYYVEQQNIERWKHTRIIAAATLNCDPRKVIELPGDYDHLEVWDEGKIKDAKERLKTQLKQLNGRRK